ncbi:Unknown protein [Striga hermonthica]|uniref:Uncharacterized protein n=1 Tax=Striga hermonthica TaxID=68872 RepID=A0A9N7NEH6_STRHE|nr:Unknown protein [Striga hermonthica]
MRNKPWPFYIDWVDIFGKDHATGDGAEGLQMRSKKSLLIRVTMPPHNSRHGRIVCSFEATENEMESSLPPGVESSASRKGKRVGKHKRFLDTEDQVVGLLSTLCENADKRFSQMLERIGFQHDAKEQHKVLYEALNCMPALSTEELDGDEKTDIESFFRHVGFPLYDDCVNLWDLRRAADVYMHGWSDARMDGRSCLMTLMKAMELMMTLIGWLIWTCREGPVQEWMIRSCMMILMKTMELAMTPTGQTGRRTSMELHFDVHARLDEAPGGDHPGAEEDDDEVIEVPAPVEVIDIESSDEPDDMEMESDESCLDSNNTEVELMFLLYYGVCSSAIRQLTSFSALCVCVGIMIYKLEHVLGIFMIVLGYVRHIIWGIILLL